MLKLENPSQNCILDGFTVDDHGNIRIPILGELNVIGYTLEEIRIRIEKQLLAEYFKKEANIFVTVKLAGFKYTINGEVGSAGTKVLFQDHVNIMEAIANSGDITITGNRKAVTIIRQSPTGSEMHDIDLTDINVMKSPYFYLQPNDYIYVKPLKTKNMGNRKNRYRVFRYNYDFIVLGYYYFFIIKKLKYISKMLDIKDFSIFENQASFDFKGFLIKIGSYWKWFLLSLLITFTIAYQVNIRKEKIYAMETLISVKEESNPLFTSNTSLVFNWGGTSDQVQTISTTLQSRSHNELVVDKLQYYIDYLSQGKYNIVDAYGAVPFYVNIDKSKGQLAGTLISIKFLSDNEYEIRIPFENNAVSMITYSDNSYSTTAVAVGEFVKRYKVGEQVSLPFLNWKLQIKDNPGFYKGNEYFVQFNDFDGTVAGYKGINVRSDDKGGSIITLGMQGRNKARMVEYLNATVKMLIKRQLDDKNQFATNTIGFIDSTLVAMESQLKETGNELKSFRKDKNIYDIEDGGAKFSGQILEFDVKKDEITS